MSQEVKRRDAPWEPVPGTHECEVGSTVSLDFGRDAEEHLKDDQKDSSRGAPTRLVKQAELQEKTVSLLRADLELLMTEVMKQRAKYGQLITALNASWAEMADEPGTAQLAAEEMFMFGYFLREKMIPISQYREQVVILDQWRQNALASIELWTSGEKCWQTLGLVLPIVAHLNAAEYGWNYLGGAGAEGDQDNLRALYELPFMKVDWSSYTAQERELFLSQLVHGYRKAENAEKGKKRREEESPYALAELGAIVARAFWTQEQTPSSFFVPGASTVRLEEAPALVDEYEEEKEKARCRCGGCGFCYYIAALSRIVTKVRTWGTVNSDQGQEKMVEIIQAARDCVVRGDCATVKLSALTSLYSSDNCVLSLPSTEGELISCDTILLFEAERRSGEVWGGRGAFVVSLRGAVTSVACRDGGLTLNREVSSVHRLLAADCVPDGVFRQAVVRPRELGFSGPMALVRQLASCLTLPRRERGPLDHVDHCGGLCCRALISPGWYHRRDDFTGVDAGSSWAFLNRTLQYFEEDELRFSVAEGWLSPCGIHLGRFFRLRALRLEEREKYVAQAKVVESKAFNEQSVDLCERSLFLDGNMAYELPKQLPEVCKTSLCAREIPFSLEDAARPARLEDDPREPRVVSAELSLRYIQREEESMDQGSGRGKLKRVFINPQKLEYIGLPQFDRRLESAHPWGRYRARRLGWRIEEMTGIHPYRHWQDEAPPSYDSESDGEEGDRLLERKKISRGSELWATIAREAQEVRKEREKLQRFFAAARTSPEARHHLPFLGRSRSGVEEEEEEEEERPTPEVKEEAEGIGVAWTPLPWIRESRTDFDSEGKNYVFIIGDEADVPHQVSVGGIGYLVSDIPALAAFGYGLLSQQGGLMPAVLLNNLSAGRGGEWMGAPVLKHTREGEGKPWGFHLTIKFTSAGGEKLVIRVTGRQKTKKDGATLAYAVMWSLVNGTLHRAADSRRVGRKPRRFLPP